MAESSVLNVDDYIPGRYARTKLLQQMGFHVYEAGTGEEALQMVRQHKPAIVLLDVNLPDMSGFEVCRRLRSNPETEGITIVHISASNIQPQHKVHGLNSGADGYLVEPVEPEVLAATVNAFLRSRRAEEALRKSTEELRWFSYRVAHDLSEPLRTITVYAQLLKRAEGGEARGETSKYLDFMADAAVRMQSFIDGLLDYSRASALPAELSTIDCEELFNRVTANLGAAIQESGAHIIPRGLPVIDGDPRVEYVLQNLVSNAIKYRRPDAPPEIEVSARQDGDAWLLSVRDNGMGIAPEHLESVFEVFRRLHGHEIPGNGIGLALCRKIVQAQGGEIWVESQPGVGTTFYFTLPVKAASLVPISQAGSGL